MKNYQKPAAEVVELLSAQEIATTGTTGRPGATTPPATDPSQTQN